MKPVEHQYSGMEKRSMTLPAEPQHTETEAEASHDVYLHDDEEIAFLLWDVLELHKCVLGRPPFASLGRRYIEELLHNAKRHARSLADHYSDANGDHARLLENGEVAIPSAYHTLWREHLRDWFWLRLQGDTSAIGGTAGEYLPHVVTQTIVEMFVGANPSFMAYGGFTPSAVTLIKERGTERQKTIFLDKLSTVEWDACLCTTESQAGSDLSAIETRATRIDGEIFSISGQKKYITAGMHSLTLNTVYIVLGRVQGSKPSPLSLSVFLVPRYWIEDDGTLSSNHVHCAKVDVKMGFSGCATTHLLFGNDGVTRGYLLGNSANVGLLQLRMLMRKARIGTGQLALAMASSAYLRSLRYARERIQGAPFDQSSNPGARRVPIIEHRDVQRMLLEMKSRVEGCRGLLAKLSMNVTKFQQCQHTLPQLNGDSKRYRDLAFLYAPIAKAYVSDEMWHVATLAIQIHGAAGYMRDLPLEQYARDIKILSIWEGTNYIQSQDLVRDKLGFGRQSLALAYLEEDIRTCLACAEADAGLRVEVELITKALGAVRDAMSWVSRSADAGNLLTISQFCTRLMQMFGDLIVSWCLLEAAMASRRRLEPAEKDDARRLALHNGKLKTMRHFVHNTLPRLFTNHEIISSAQRSYVEVESKEFGYICGSSYI